MTEVRPDLGVLAPGVGGEVVRLRLLAQEREILGLFGVGWRAGEGFEVQPVDALLCREAGTFFQRAFGPAF